MSNYNFSETIQEAEKKYGVGGSNSFKFQQGKNKIRILACSSKPLANHYLGKGQQQVACIGEDKGCFYHGINAITDEKGNPKKASIQYLVYLLDKATDIIEFAYMPYTIIKTISTLQNSEDYAFKDLPMPYDLNVEYNKEASPTEKYKVLPSPKVEIVPTKILNELKEKKNLDVILEQIKSKQVTKENPNQVNGVEIPVIEPDQRMPQQDEEIEFEEESIKEKDLPF